MSLINQQVSVDNLFVSLWFN